MFYLTAFCREPIMQAVLCTSATMFENPEIAHEDLPQVETVTWQGMDSKFTRRLLTEAALALVFVTIGVAGLQVIFKIAFADQNLNINLGWLWLLVPLLAIPLLA